ncbi:TIGR04255 family protein [Proteus mirabilis]|nr:TIGR04255 family protein [Proteus mirabilis]
MNQYGLVYVLMKIEFDRISTTDFYQKFDTFSSFLKKSYPISPPINQIKAFKVDMKNFREEQPEVTQFEIPMMTFLSPEKDFGIRVAPDFLIVHTKKYRGFNDIRERVNSILQALIDTYDISYYSFLGLRYVNKFEYSKTSEFDDLIKRTDFLQPKLCDWGRAGSNMTSSYFDLTNDIALALNTGVMINAPVVSPDLMEIASDFIEPTKRLDGPIAHIDIDTSFSTDDGSMKPLSVDEIISNLSILRDAANKAYKNIIVS